MTLPQSSNPTSTSSGPTIIVVGHGMVGQRLVEKLVLHSSTFEISERPQILVFGEEVHSAYDRVKLTAYFEHLDPNQMLLQDRAWYDDNKDQVTILTNERVVRFDSETRVVFTQSGKEFTYDKLVLATGSVPFVPPIPGICVGHVNTQFFHPASTGFCAASDGNDTSSESCTSEASIESDAATKSAAEVDVCTATPNIVARSDWAKAHCGWGVKKVRGRRTTFFAGWKKQFFVLHKETKRVSFYTNSNQSGDKGEGAIKGTIPLHDVKVALNKEEVEGYANVVVITSSNASEKATNISFASTEEASQWVKEINESIDGYTSTAKMAHENSISKLGVAAEEDIAHEHTTGVFVYRTIADLEDMLEYAKTKELKTAAVIGGGLLGLEAMRVCTEHLAVKDVCVIDVSDWPMRRQLDEMAGKQLISKIEEMGYKVHTKTRTNKVISTDGCVSHLGVNMDGEQKTIAADLVIIAAGIRPRDDLGRFVGAPEGLAHERGGFPVDDEMRTSVPNVYAVGECAVHNKFIYGLVAPCYEQAAVLAYNLVAKDAEVQPKEFKGGDLSTKLKLMGVDVASFGEYAINAGGKENSDDVMSLVYNDPFAGIYRKLTVSKDGSNLLGGILVGDASDYATLAMLAKSTKPLKVSVASLLPPPSSNTGGGGGMTILDMDDEAQVCSCNDISKGQVCESVRDGGCETVADITKCTKAGASCGGCKPMIQELLADEMSKMGKEMDNTLCPHFAFTRQELFHIVLVNEIKSFDDLYSAHSTDTGGTYRGCETCRPAVASILASLWNDLVVSPANAALQDTNDRFLGNIQRGGSYSVVPRIAAGEITPEKLVVLGQVAKKYGLYTKITGGQRIDLFGAEKHQLPDIWEELVNAGFESGHAYGKSLRTVKSCVGSTWCRYGMRDAVGFALELEERYKGVRSPHKLKGGVSGCVRECAEAQSKDFGLIATSEGYNLYLAGNGGTKPRHAELFASGIDEATCLKYIDRFLILYIRSADKLQRTARWIEGLEGGIEYLKEVVINDKLGICAELEAQMARLIGTYKCEWTEVVKNPERRKMFIQYANEPTKSSRGIDFIDQREQRRPANWPSKWESIPHTATPMNDKIATDEESGGTRFPGGEQWVDMVHVDDIFTDSGVTLLHGKSELALFKMLVRNPSGKDTFRLFCTQNMCPHKNSFVLSSGLLGDVGGQPKVACPIHKKKYLLNSGKCMDDDRYALWTFDTRVDGEGRVSVRLPSVDELDKVLASDMFRVTKAMGDSEVIEEKEGAKAVVTEGGDSPRSALDW